MNKCHLCGTETPLYIRTKPTCSSCAELNNDMKPVHGKEHLAGPTQPQPDEPYSERKNITPERIGELITQITGRWAFVVSPGAALPSMVEISSVLLH